VNAARTKKDGARTKERAEYWGCKLRTMQIMIKDGLPVDSDAGMVEWYCRLPQRSQGMLALPFKARLGAVRAKLEGRDVAGGAGAVTDGKPFAPVLQQDADVTEFERTYKAPAGSSDDHDNLASIRRERAYYLFRMQRARARRDLAAEADAAKQFRNFSDVLHDCELRALKMGRDLGESYSAEDVKRLGRAIGFWLMQSADTVITQVAKELTEAAAAGPLDREMVRRVVEPLILRERVVAPMVRASKMEAGVSLPKVFVEAVRAGLDAVVEETPAAI
jgi:hypothetical protein